MTIKVKNIKFNDNSAPTKKVVSPKNEYKEDQLSQFNQQPVIQNFASNRLSEISLVHKAQSSATIKGL